MKWFKSLFDTEVKKYNFAIWMLVILTSVYLFFVLSIRNTEMELKKQQTEELEYQKFISNQLLPTEVNLSTDGRTIRILTVKTEDEIDFHVGEIVGVKHMGIIGIVNEKIIGLGGCTYEVIYRNGDGSLQRETFKPWILYRPTKEQLVLFTLVR